MASNISSLTDQSRYTKICQRAAQEYELFHTFKSHRDYNWVLENIGEEQGALELQRILEISPSLIKNLFWKNKPFLNDSLGKPNRYSYHIGTSNEVELFRLTGLRSDERSILVSPTTLRYIRVYSDLIKYFDIEFTNNPCKIVEIGGGYGGQRQVIHDHLNSNYLIIDLPEVIALQSRYLAYFGCPTDFISAHEVKNLEMGEFDLCISNYAFSECYREIQDIYLKKVILKSKMGYMTLNNIREEGKRYDFYSYQELLDKIPGSKLIDEVPSSHPNNKVLIWGHKS